MPAFIDRISKKALIGTGVGLGVAALVTSGILILGGGGGTDQSAEPPADQPTVTDATADPPAPPMSPTESEEPVESGPQFGQPVALGPVPPGASPEVFPDPAVTAFGMGTDHYPEIPPIDVITGAPVAAPSMQMFCLYGYGVPVGTPIFIDYQGASGDRMAWMIVGPEGWAQGPGPLSSYGRHTVARIYVPSVGALFDLASGPGGVGGTLEEWASYQGQTLHEGGSVNDWYAVQGEDLPAGMLSVWPDAVYLPQQEIGLPFPEPAGFSINASESTCDPSTLGPVPPGYAVVTPVIPDPTIGTVFAGAFSASEVPVISPVDGLALDTPGAYVMCGDGLDLPVGSLLFSTYQCGGSSYAAWGWVGEGGRWHVVGPHDGGDECWIDGIWVPDADEVEGVLGAGAGYEPIDYHAIDGMTDAGRRWGEVAWGEPAFPGERFLVPGLHIGSSSSLTTKIVISTTMEVTYFDSFSLTHRDGNCAEAAVGELHRLLGLEPPTEPPGEDGSGQAAAFDANIEIPIFVEGFAAMIDAGDADALLATLSGYALEAYGEASCRATIARDILAMDEYRLTGGIASVIKAIEIGATTQQVSGYEAEVAFEFGGQTYETKALFFEESGEVRWFTVCE